MAAIRFKVLICDDDDAFAEMLEEYLRIACHCGVERVATEEELWEKLGISEDQSHEIAVASSSNASETPYDILLLDYHLPGTNGLDILKRIGRVNINLPTVMMTGQGSEQIAARAIQAGALDYLVKGQYSFSSLEGLIERAVQVNRLKHDMQESLKKIQYQALVLNGVRDAVVVWSINGEITYWNHSAEQLFRFKADQMLGRSVYEEYFPLFHPQYQFPLPFEEGIYQSERWFWIDPDEKVWVSSQISTLQDRTDDKLTIGFMDVTRDITSTKRIEEKLQLRLQTEHLLSQLSVQLIKTTTGEDYECFHDALRKVAWQINAHFGMILIQKDMCLQSIVTYYMQARNHADENSISKDEIAIIDLTKNEHPWRISNLQKWAVISLPSVKDLPDGTALRGYLLDRNINTVILIPMVYDNGLYGVILLGLEEWGSQWEGDYDYLLRTFGQMLLRALLQQHSENDLRESEDRYRAIVDKYQTEMICRFLPDLRLTFANETFCTYYQIDRSDLVGMNFLASVLESDRDQIIEVINGLSADQPTASVSFQIHASGETRWQEWSIRGIVSPNGQVVEFQGVGRDITDRVMMEEQIQTAQTRLAQANRMASIGQLASSVAHQLSNPLTTIIGDAQLLLLGLDKDNPDQESAKAIVAAGWRAQQVIDELLKFSAMSEASREDISINDTIDEALLLSSPHILEAGIDLLIDLPTDGLIVHGNKQQIIDLWINLFLSIVTQSERRQVKKIWIGNELEDGMVRITCAHDGIAITQEEALTILDPQLVPTSAKLGTGMELSICREIVRQHDGEMIVYPSDQKTVFQISLKKGGNT